MTRRKSDNLWIFREAPAVSHTQRFVLLALVLSGLISILYFADWWFREENISNRSMFVILSVFLWYGISRNVLIWLNYLKVRKPIPVPAPQGLKVAIYTTAAPGEPISMFEKTLEACRSVSYPHTTYLLDGTRDPAFKTLAEKHGAVWLDSAGLPGAKAGKINAALKRTTEDFILVLDPDHIVFPNFLNHTLGFFEDPAVGFVQVSQAYYNQYRSFTATGAAEQTYTFYGPTQMSFYGHGCALAIGANCTFRRAALESIGGHAVGLAEDLMTSIRIHAKGWKSVFNPVIVSRGLVPEDLGSFCKQQLKWARGVFEVMFIEFPKLFRHLNFWQKITYFGIGTYYLVGITTFFFIMLPFLYFLTGILPAKMAFSDFIIRGSYIVIIAAIIYFYAQKFLCDPGTERGFHWRGMILKYTCWPVFMLGFLLSVINVDIPYIPTEKKAVIGSITPFAMPLIIYSLLFIITIIGIFIHRRLFVPEGALLLSSVKTWGMVGFSFIAFLMSLGGILAALESKWIKEENPWEKVELSKIKV